ncbi:MAG: glycosyltransferase [Phycisphaeraceae bacterium]
MTATNAQVGVVAIGRNEGERLKRCLAAAVAQAAHVVYVDSGSTDGSVAFARSLGVEVVELDLSTPFTAARARNAGFNRLIDTAPDTAFVQFIDGDCELVDGYIVKALAAFENKDRLAVVSGRRRERHRDATLFNRLCDMEWDTPIGAVNACHGDATIRRCAFEDVGGFDQTMIAGEEPEMCVRLRAKGWTLERIDCEMTLHDAAMDRVSQWWTRMVRAGHAYAEGADKHGGPPEFHNVKQVRSAITWGIALPAFAIAFVLVGIVQPWVLTGFWIIVLASFAMLFKIALYRRRKGDRWFDALFYAYMTLKGKLPTALGVLKYHRNKRSGKRSKLIEYKSEGVARG